MNAKDSAELKSLLAKGRIKDVIDRLKKNADVKTTNTLILFSRELEEQREDERLSIKTQNQITAQKNKLTHNLLELIDEIALVSSPSSNYKDQGRDDNFKLIIGNRTLRLLVLGVIILAILYFIFIFFVLQKVPDNSTIIPLG